jgi:hypothetical protein
MEDPDEDTTDIVVDGLPVDKEDKTTVADDFRDPDDTVNDTE